MELSQTQKELTEELSRRGVAQADILSLMLCLTKEEKASAFLLFLRENKTLSEDALFRKAGEIAFGESQDGI